MRNKLKNMSVNIKTEQEINIDRIKEYMNVYIFSFGNGFNFKKNKNSWRDYIIPVKNKEENISENIDKILY